jgi:hypothetical protein
VSSQSASALVIGAVVLESFHGGDSSATRRFLASLTCGPRPLVQSTKAPYALASMAYS